MTAREFFDWQSRKEGAGRAHPRRADQVDREEPAKPSEPIEVQEHGTASTTIVRALRRFWTDKRN